MFGNLFGWRKASKCKRLLKAVKYRLKLLKNRKCCVANQLRKDVTELLKYGLDQIALQRVEQLIKDETTVQVYDLLDQFCERIILSLPYIRKHKDCPKEINEAASTVIFSSARLGELPELLSIRKLFEERYGKRFVMVALELLPGNIVNRQMIETVCEKNVSDDVKYTVLDEIASSCIQSGQYLLEYKPYHLQEHQARNSNILMSRGQVQISSCHKGSEDQLYPTTEEMDGKVMPPEKRFSLAQGCNNVLTGVEDSYSDEADRPPEDCDEMSEYALPAKSSSEASAQLPEEIVYLDDIQENYILHVCKGERLQDLRLFKLKSSGMPSSKKRNRGINICAKEQKIFPEESVVGRSRKRRKGRMKRPRIRLISQESRIVTDTESAAYYGESEETSTNSRRKRKSYFRHRNNIFMEGSRKSYGTKFGKSFGDDDSGEDIPEKSSRLNHPCYENGMQKRAKDFSIHSQKEGAIIPYEHQFCKIEDNVGGEVIRAIHDRTMSMPAERPEEDPTDNITRSSSFPFEQRRSKYSSCRHVHPKLPDYDELAAKFLELKRSNVRGNSS